MPGDRDEEMIGIARIDRELGDLLAVAQAEMGPGFAGVGRFVDAVADGEIGPMQSFAAPDVDDVGIGNRNRERADRAGRLIIENRLPGASVIVRLENAAIDLREIENVRLRRHARDRADPSAAVGPDVAPVEEVGKIGARRKCELPNEKARQRKREESGSFTAAR